MYAYFTMLSCVWGIFYVRTRAGYEYIGGTSRAGGDGSRLRLQSRTHHYYEYYYERSDLISSCSNKIHLLVLVLSVVSRRILVFL